jgi:hypothetical protein
MPTLTRWYVKAALTYFVLALAMGFASAAKEYLPYPDITRSLTPVYFHLFMVGWVTQLIFGVVHWMFPNRTRELPRGSISLAWATFIILNMGLILRVFAEPLAATQGGTPWQISLAVSAVLQWLAGLGFLVNTWPRVKGR